MKTGKSIKGALNYNEQKVSQGKAELILASQFGCDVDELKFSQKLTVFESLNLLNPKSKVNTLHLSLNFPPEETLNTETLQRIAMDYMEKIGFGSQPYLVYQHNDTGHTHLHIVTTTIRPDGKPIYLHNIGKRLSEPARKAIELEYGLIRAESRKQHNKIPEPENNIESIVSKVVYAYNFTSLDELNAVLRRFDIIADRGNVNSAMYQNNGLIYCKIDENGYKKGVPIKASSIYSGPTLSVLEKKFEVNRLIRPPYQMIAQKKINSILAKCHTTTSFMHELTKNNISCSLQYEPDGMIKEISFVDHHFKSVFSSNDIGLSVNAILYKLNRILRYTDKPATINTLSNSESPAHLFPRKTGSFDLLKILLTTEAYQSDLSPEFLKRKRKKRKP